MSIQARLHQLSAFLEAHRQLWVPRPFIAQPVDWEATHPALSRWLRSLDDNGIDAVDHKLANGEVGGLDASIVPVATEAARLSALPGLPHIDASLGFVAPTEEWRPPLHYRIPGRKWSQIEALVRSITADSRPISRLVDWCAGKSHLGRTLGAVTGAHVVSIERQAPLLDKGRQLAADLGVSMEPVVADVMTESLIDVARGADTAVGLHACGALTDALIETAIDADIPRLVSVMCCYHVLAPNSTWRPRSRAAQSHPVALDDKLLRLPIFDEVVAPGRERVRRRRTMVWRAGWDLLRRELTGVDTYQSPGDGARPAVSLPFRQFVEFLAQREGLNLPQHLDFEQWRRAGEQWARRARALGNARAVFRRPLEVWLVLDRAARLEEEGYTVQIGTFCPRNITPRNIAMVAHRG